MMDSEVSETVPARQLRRSTRQTPSARDQLAVNYGPTPRGPLKRAKKPPKPQSEVPAVNGTKEKGSDDEESPEKKSRLQTGDVLGGGDVHGPPKDESEPMETQDKSGDANVQIKSLQQSKNPPVPGSFGDVHLKPYVVLVPHCTQNHPESESVTKTQVKQPKKNDASPSKHTTTTIPSKRANDTHHTTVPSMAEYRRKMESKITEIPKVNHYVPGNYPKSVETAAARRRTTDSSTHKAGVAEKKHETKKIPVSRQKGGASSKGFLRYLWKFVLLILLSAGLLLAFKDLPTLQGTKDGSTHSSRSANSGLFVEELSRVVIRFPSQRPELWKRSKIHLQKHLDNPHPTEPVSMILTAGVRAQKTLLCLAHSIASSFSSALNTSVVVIDGASQANLDSDKVKMDIDDQLKAAFGGDKLASVIHRFEELPPGSSLIFYRYCDHETAAYKRAFILFTVLLSEEDLSTQQSLKEVEEMVRDHVERKFVGNETAFNKMDADKFSGLWSRISHLILPVAHEDGIELKGC
uniref:Torsin-1A-interacting protein 1/2 AAA+ activator domain-containing protein n=1 Tax=Neogobius melanostomus TaxID=47308 RepID=A0A8C6TBC9_9GOBI